MMVKGDKLGAFSAEDMARNFPQIAAVTKSTGREGLDAVAEMVAQAQIIRRGFGSSSEAATAQREILNKLFSPEVIKNFAESGMNMESLNKKATAENRPLVDVVIEAIEKNGLGDKFDLAGLVQDTNARAALEALKMNGDLYKEMLGQISGANGVVDKDLQTVQELPIEKERRREAARNEGWRKLGEVWGGVSAPFADFFSRMLSDEFDKLRTNEDRDAQISTYQKRIEEARATKSQIEANPSNYPGADFQIADLKAEISRLETAISALKSQSGAALGQSLGPAAEKSMQDYKEKISIEGDAAIGIAKEKAAQLKAAFSFTATPTISPRFGGSSGSPAAAQPAGLSLTQHISGTGNPERVAAAASRRQDRAIRTARAGALHDMGSLA
ncbi:minor tail protein [Hoeflea marina]|uniref:Minor tail protein n=1 Tax=Hoeflea marina TaxID=274592 RepID=A0A317PDH6_9HYPH|nr:phage tail tape measure protein [Hoeflea marina]PWV97695.1 minor tail protein [Hoeflea marina]